MSTCRSCRHSAPVADSSDPGVGMCQYAPPVFVPPSSASFPPVNLDTWRCGRHEHRNWFRRLLASLVRIRSA